MIQNAAFLAMLTVFLLVAWLAGELTFLAPYKSVLFRDYGDLIVATVLILFLNLCALFYGIARFLFLRDAGRKLTHVDRQLRTNEAIHEELREHLLSAD